MFGFLKKKRDDELPYDMFDVAHGDREARGAKRLESIYHWPGSPLFSSEGEGVDVPLHRRIAHAGLLIARARDGVLEIAERTRNERRARPSPVVEAPRQVA